MEINSENRCMIHIYEHNKGNFVRVVCPKNLTKDTNNWDPSFDATAKHIYWFNSQTEEYLQILNPLVYTN